MLQKAKFVLRACALAGLMALPATGRGETPQQASERLMTNYRAMVTRNILVSPIPKHLNFYQAPLKLEQLALVVLKTTEYTDIAVDELNSRIAELGGGRLAVNSKAVPGKYNLIVDPEFSVRKLPAQGYQLIREKTGVRLVGADRMGLLYAAVTARGLFCKNKDGVIYHAAEVTDWPDIVNRRVNGGERTYYRELYREDSKRFFEASVPWVKNLFRYKVNSMGHHTYTPFQDCFSPFRQEPDVPEKYLKLIGELNKYADRFGIKRSVTMSIQLGKLAQNGKNPAVKDLTLIPWHDAYFSWGHPELQTIAAQKMLNWAKAAGINRITLHPVDGGSVIDPELWSTRDAASKKMYPQDSDRAKADAAQLDLYRKVFAGSGVELVLCPYPYFGSNATREGVAEILSLKPNSPLVDKYLNSILQWGCKLNGLIPADTVISLREGTATELKAFTSMFPGHKFKFYFETSVFRFLHDDHPLLSPYVTAVTTMQPYAAEVGRANGAQYYEPFIPATAEYLWNVHAPHYTEWEKKLSDDPRRLPFLSEYTCTATWGAEIGKIVAPAFSSGLSFQYLIRPEEVDRAWNVKDALPLCEQARQKLHTAIKVFDAAQKKLDAEGGFEHYALGYPAKPVFNQYRVMLYGCRIFVDGRYARLRMMKAIQAGKMKEVTAIAEEAVASLRKSASEFEQLTRKYKADDLLMPLDRITTTVYLFEQAMRPDVNQEIRSIQSLEKQKQKIFAETNLPLWLQKSFKSPLPYSRTSEPISVDGKATEAAWKKALPVEHFIDTTGSRLIPAPVSVRVLYDNDHLYVSGTAERSGLQGCQETKTCGSECFQLFFPAKDGTTRQMMVFPNGKILSHAGKTMPESQKISITAVPITAECKTFVGTTQWSFELKLSFAELGGKPETALFAYEMAPEKGETAGIYFATSPAGNGSFFNAKNYRKFAEKTAEAESQGCVSVYLSQPVELKDALHASGTGTMIAFKPVIECTRPVKSLQAYAEVLDLNGSLLKKSAVANEAFVSAMHVPTGVSVLTDTIQKAAVIKITVQYQLDGKDCIATAYFPAGKIRAEEFRKLCPELADGTFAAWHPRRIDLKQGSVAFKMRYTRPEARSKAVFHAATVNRRYPETANNNSIQAFLYGQYLSVTTWNRQFARRSLMVRLSPDRWHDVRIEWNAERGKCDLAVTVNGTKHEIPESDPQLKKSIADDFTETDFIQFNALNTGYLPAYVQLKELIVNDAAITAQNLYAGCAAPCNAVYPAAFRFYQDHLF